MPYGKYKYQHFPNQEYNFDSEKFLSGKFNILILFKMKFSQFAVIGGLSAVVLAANSMYRNFIPTSMRFCSISSGFFLTFPGCYSGSLMLNAYGAFVGSTISGAQRFKWVLWTAALPRVSSGIPVLLCQPGTWARISPNCTTYRQWGLVARHSLVHVSYHANDHANYHANYHLRGSNGDSPNQVPYCLLPGGLRWSRSHDDGYLCIPSLPQSHHRARNLVLKLPHLARKWRIFGTNLVDIVNCIVLGKW